MPEQGIGNWDDGEEERTAIYIATHDETCREIIFAYGREYCLQPLINDV